MKKAVVINNFNSKTLGFLSRGQILTGIDFKELDEVDRYYIKKIGWIGNATTTIDYSLVFKGSFPHPKPVEDCEK